MKEFTLNLPDTVEVEGKFYPIKTNFADWLIFSQLIQDKKTILGDLDSFYIGTPPRDRITGFNALFSFYSPIKELPKAVNSSNVKLIDYCIDFDLIYSAFMEKYKIDLYDEKTRLHWHKFLALIMGLSNTKLNDIMGYRAYTGKDKELIRLRNQWALPQSLELSQATKDFNALFDK